jgi:hypothetical protein
MFPMPGFLVNASFYVEGTATEAEAEETFETWLTEVTALDDDSSVAFDCVQAVIAAGDYGVPTETETPEAELKEGVAA